MDDYRCPQCGNPWPDCTCPGESRYIDEDVPATEPDDSGALWLDVGGEG
jgi:hypothetical protein